MDTNVKENTEMPQAYVTEINGETVLVDPVGYAVIQAVEKCNCKATFKMNLDRIKHFKDRIVEKGLDPKTIVIVAINVDDPHGGPIADVLMPGFNWQEIRDEGKIPFARGLAQRDGMKEILETFDKEASKKLETILENAVIVVDHGVAEIFRVE